MAKLSSLAHNTANNHSHIRKDMVDHRGVVISGRLETRISRNRIRRDLAALEEASIARAATRTTMIQQQSNRITNILKYRRKS